MKKSKIFLAMLLAVVMVLSVVALAACKDDEETAKDAAHTIYFYSSQGQALQEKTLLAIQSFEAKYPGWKVQHSSAGDYDDVKEKILSDLPARQQPDLAYCYPDHVAEYLKTGAVVNLNTLLYSEETVNDKDGNAVRVGYTEDELRDFVSGYWNEGKARNYADYERYGLDEEAMLTLPFVKSTELMYTNTSALKYICLKLASEGKTTDSALFGTINGTTVTKVSNQKVTYVKTDDKGQPKNVDITVDAFAIDGDIDVGDKVTVNIAQTWDVLWKQCEIIKREFPNSTPLGYDSEANWFITMCQQNGWDYTRANGVENYTFYNKNTEDWLKELKGYYDKALFTTEEISGQYTSNLFKLGVGKVHEVTSKDNKKVVSYEATLEKDDGGCVYCIGSSGGASYQKSDTGNFNTEIYPIPGVDASHNYCISQGPSLVMLQGGYRLTAEQQALKLKMTFLFVKELLDPSFQATFSIASGYNPARDSVFEIPAYVTHLSGTDSTAKAAKAAQQLSDRFFVSPAFDGSSKARLQVGNALVFAVKGEKDASRALIDAYSNCKGSAPSGYFAG